MRDYENDYTVVTNRADQFMVRNNNDTPETWYILDKDTANQLVKSGLTSCDTSVKWDARKQLILNMDKSALYELIRAKLKSKELRVVWERDYPSEPGYRGKRAHYIEVEFKDAD